MSEIRSIAVFCGSSPGQSEEYAKAAEALGKLLAKKNIHLVYGGAQIGIMGMVADAVLTNGGKVTGVIPNFLDKKEVAHTGLTELIRVDSMHDRKRIMAEKSDAFIALPGGFGTLEEVVEMLTWGQLGLHKKPVAFLNTQGFYIPLFNLMDRMVLEGFLRPEHRSMVLSHAFPGPLLDLIDRYVPRHHGLDIKIEQS